MIKKIFSFVLVLFTVFVLVGCGDKKEEPGIEVKNDGNMYVHEIDELEVVLKPSGESVTEFDCLSTDENVLLYSDGKVYAKAEGEASLAISVKHNEKDYSFVYNVIVTNSPTKISELSVTGDAGVIVGKTITLTCKQEVLWSSSDESVATVDENGVVTGVKKGDVLIYATLKSDETIKKVYELVVIDEVGTVNVGTGSYYFDQITGYNKLPFGVTEYTHWGYTSTGTSGIDDDGLGPSKGKIEADKYYSQQVNVLEVPSQLDTKVVVWANTNNHIWTLTSVRSMINDYEAQHPGYKVVAAVNGDFFDINGNHPLKYSTSGATMANGHVYKATTGNAIGFTNDGTANSLIGGGVPEKTSYMVLAIYDENNNIIGEYKVDNNNVEPEAGKVSAYFGIYNGEHQYVPQSFSTNYNAFVIDEAIKALPNYEQDFYGLGVISSLDKERTLEKGQFAIVSDNAELNNALKVGTKIRVQYEFVGKFENADSITGCGDHVLANGELEVKINVNDNLYTRAPRTSIGVREDGTLIMCVVDGRQYQKGMYGVDGNELGSIMKAYGCVEAFNLDGGGSSTVVIRTSEGFKVLNSPSDGNERNDSNCVLIVAKDPEFKSEVSDITINSATVNVTVGDESYKEYPVYVKMNGVMYEVKDGKVSFDGLVSNTTYGYKVYYKDNNGNYVQTLEMGSFKTLKTGFSFTSIVVTEDENYYIFTANYNDPDNASNVQNAEITIGGTDIVTYMSKGVLKLKKNLLEGIELTTIGLKFTYVDGTETKEFNNDNVDYFIIK